MDKFQQIACTITISLLATGCQWNVFDTIEYDNIIGDWTLYEINGEIIPTDSAYCVKFNDDFSGYFAVCTPDKNWNSYERTYSYNPRLRELRLEGDFYNNKYYKTTFKVDECNGQTMNLTVKNLAIDDTAVNDNRIITLKRMTAIDPEQFVGLWEGYEYDNDDYGRKLGENHRWEYFEDGSFNYYHDKDAEGEWRTKNDNDGHYYLYCNFLATTYLNDINEGTTGRSCECWLISIDGDVMNWMAIRGGKTHRFTMQRVTEQ